MIEGALVAVIPAAALAVVRAVNTRRARDPWGSSGVDPRDLSGDDLARPGMTVDHVRDGDVVGLHLVPDELSRTGAVVTFGGSEGSPDLERAVEIAARGYEVFAMFFFGQPGQQDELVHVPLERWSRIRGLVEREAANPSTVTVIASSKSAEFALCAASHFDDIDHLVLFAPSAYRFPGLTQERAESERSSWTLDEVELPCIPFSTKSPRAMAWLVPFLARQLLGLPARYGTIYAGALRCATPAVRHAARIDAEHHTGDLLLFAGKDDRMWPSATFAQTIAAHRHEKTEVFLFSDAGHVFGAPATWSGIHLGGAPEANGEAAARSTAILKHRLDAWHSPRTTPASADLTSA